MDGWIDRSVERLDSSSFSPPPPPPPPPRFHLDRVGVAGEADIHSAATAGQPRQGANVRVEQPDCRGSCESPRRSAGEEKKQGKCRCRHHDRDRDHRRYRRRATLIDGWMVDFFFILSRPCTMRRRAVVLLSGGKDSVYSIRAAREEFGCDVVCAAQLKPYNAPEARRAEGSGDRWFGGPMVALERAAKTLFADVHRSQLAPIDRSASVSCFMIERLVALCVCVCQTATEEEKPLTFGSMQLITTSWIQCSFRRWDALLCPSSRGRLACLCCSIRPRVRWGDRAKRGACLCCFHAQKACALRSACRPVGSTRAAI